MLDCPPVSKLMDSITKQFRNRVAQTIKDRRKSKPTQRVQVNASFSKAEYAAVGQVARAKGISPARLVKELALQSIDKSPSTTETKLVSLTATIQETSQLLRTLYRDSKAWHIPQLKELRPLLRRFLQLERKAFAALDDLLKQKDASEDKVSPSPIPSGAERHANTSGLRSVTDFWKGFYAD